MSLLLRILRNTALTILALLFLAFALVQFQQRLLRHRAEQLNADIAALRDRPATWADLQRIQHHWGAFAHYDGPCNPQHCDYIIYLTAPFYSLVYSNQRHPFYPDLLIPIYQKLGGRSAVVDADIRLTHNLVWATSIEVDLGDSWPIMASVYWGPRLFTGFGGGLLSGLSGKRPSPRDVRRGYLIYQPGACTGCIMRRVHLTPATPPSDRARLSVINFACLTRLHPCTSMTDLLPNAEAQNLADRSDPDDADASCQLSPKTLATEADNIIAIDLLASGSTQEPDNDIEYIANARVTARLKNAALYYPGRTVHVAEGGTFSAKPFTKFYPPCPFRPEDISCSSTLWTPPAIRIPTPSIHGHAPFFWTPQPFAPK